MRISCSESDLLIIKKAAKQYRKFSIETVQQAAALDKMAVLLGYFDYKQLQRNLVETPIQTVRKNELLSKVARALTRHELFSAFEAYELMTSMQLGKLSGLMPHPENVSPRHPDVYYVLAGHIYNETAYGTNVKGKSIADVIKRGKIIIEYWNPEYQGLKPVEIYENLFKREHCFEIYEVNAEWEGYSFGDFVDSNDWLERGDDIISCYPRREIGKIHNYRIYDPHFFA